MTATSLWLSDLKVRGKHLLRTTAYRRGTMAIHLAARMIGNATVKGRRKSPFILRENRSMTAANALSEENQRTFRRELKPRSTADLGDTGS
jgi:hypothetical protein